MALSLPTSIDTTGPQEDAQPCSQHPLMTQDSGGSIVGPTDPFEPIIIGDEEEEDSPSPSPGLSCQQSVATTTTEAVKQEDDEVQFIGQVCTRRLQLAHSGLPYFPGQEYPALQSALHRVLKSAISCLHGDPSPTASEILVNLRHDAAGVMNMDMSDLNNSIQVHYQPNLEAAFGYVKEELRKCERFHRLGLRRKEDRDEFARGVLARHEARFARMKQNGRQGGRLQKDLGFLRERPEEDGAVFEV